LKEKRLTEALFLRVCKPLSLTPPPVISVSVRKRSATPDSLTGTGCFASVPAGHLIPERFADAIIFRLSSSVRPDIGFRPGGVERFYRERLRWGKVSSINRASAISSADPTFVEKLIPLPGSDFG